MSDNNNFKKSFKKFSDNGDRKPFNKFKKGGRQNRRFFQNAVSFGKKGNYGRGTHIDEEDFTYFIGILQAEKDTQSESREEKVAMANNVMAQTKDNEIKFSSNQVVSKVLESLLGYVDAEHLENYFKVFGENLRPICSDVYSSHVLQKLIEIALLRAVGVEDTKETLEPPKKFKDVITELKYNTSEHFSDEHRAECSNFVLKTSKFLLNNLEDFVEDSNACHLLRSAILNLAGVHIPKTPVDGRGKPIKHTEKFNGLRNFHRVGEFKIDKTVFKVPDEWTEILMEFPGRLQMWPHFKEFPYRNHTSVLLQVICIALHTANKESLDAFGKKLITDTFMNVEITQPQTFSNGYDEEETNEHGNDEAHEEKVGQKEQEGGNASHDSLPSVFKSDSAVRLLQALIAVASPKLLNKINKLFKDRLLLLINSNHGIFAVERLINYICDKSEFEAIVDQLIPHFEEFLQTNKSNFLCSLSATCLRLKAKQAAFITALQNSLGCNPSLGEDRPKAFFNCLLNLKPFDALPHGSKTYVGLLGSLIIQDILQFNKPIFLVNSILETPVKTLVETVICANGSFIGDKFLSSPTIGEKSREKFVKLFEGFYLDLAVNQFGSRIVELLMKAANDPQKVMIAKELTEKENKLKCSFYGKIIFNVLRLETFKLSKEQWKASFTAKQDGEQVKKFKKEKTDDEKMDTNEETIDTQKTTSKKNKKNKKRPPT